MLNIEHISVRSVLVKRRALLPTRLAVLSFLTVNYGFMVGWPPIIACAALYLAVQWFEHFGFARPNAFIKPGYAHEEMLGICVLVVNSTIFGAPTLLLTHDLGSWGAAASAYMVCGAVLNAGLTTIGCRPAFAASAFPFFVYLCILPFNTLDPAGHLALPLLITMIGGGFFLSLNVLLLWMRGTSRRLAEIEAARRYVADREETEKRLLRLTQLDALTGLLNRTVLQERLAKNAEHSGAGALLMIDLDGFKYVNDTLGHSAGDAVLRDIAKRICDAARQAGGTAARLGGDEFALLLPGVADPEAALASARHLIAQIAMPVSPAGQQINIGASIGVVLHPLHGQEAEALFANADLALYQAKAEGRQCARLYHAELRLRAQGKVLRDTELACALERGEFEMFYQPQVRLADGAVTGAEALLRWHHPQLGLLGPKDFIGALEGGLLSARVGDWVIETACRQAAVWRAGIVPEFKIAVNVFGAQFRCGNLVEWVMQACDQAGLPAEALELEITENVILRHEDEIIAPLRELRARGVGVAFDDYGTGFASLSTLTRFPVSRLKIDQRFVRAICESVPEAAVIHAVMGLARALELSVTAEGVENEAQARALAWEGCKEAQGYLYGEPMGQAAFAQRFMATAAAD
jgi:diguanylate cyclase (GGDEF)-like protein